MTLRVSHHDFVATGAVLLGDDGARPETHPVPSDDVYVGPMPLSWAGRLEKTAGSLPLQLLLEMIMAGLRQSTESGFDFSGHHQNILRQTGLEPFLQWLDRHHPHQPSINLRNVIFQSPDQNRAVVELVSNALDAGADVVNVRLEEGRLEVADNGAGMNPKTLVENLLVPRLSSKRDAPMPSSDAGPIGRFGIGFYTVLRHLIAEAGANASRWQDHLLEGASVIVETQTADEGAWRLQFQVREGDIRVTSGAIPESRSGTLSGTLTGTRVLIESPVLRQAAIEVKMRQFLRHVEASRTLLLNGVRLNAAQAPEKLGEFKGTTFYFNGGVTDRFTLKVGAHVIVEQYEVPAGLFGGELIVELPGDTELSQIREKVMVDARLYRAFEALLGLVRSSSRFSSLQEKLHVLSGLVIVAQAFESDRRNRNPSFMELLRRQAGLLFSGAQGRVYPLSMREQTRAGQDVFFADEHLLSKRHWAKGLKVPPEFMGGQTIEASGLSRGLQAYLSPDLTVSHHYDQTTATLYLGAAAYADLDPVQRAAFFAVPHLQWEAQWAFPEVQRPGKSLQKAAQPSVILSPGNEMLALMVSDPKKRKAIDRFMSRQGLSVERLSRLRVDIHRYSQPPIVQAGGRLYSTRGDDDRRIVDLVHPHTPLFTSFRYPSLMQISGRHFLKVSDQQGRCSLLDLDQQARPVLPFVYQDLELQVYGNRIFVKAEDEQARWGIFDLEDPEKILLPFRKKKPIFLGEHDNSFLVLDQVESGKHIIRDLAHDGRLWREVCCRETLQELYLHEGRVLASCFDDKGRVGVVDLDSGRFLLPCRYTPELYLAFVGDRIFASIQKRRGGKVGLVDLSDPRKFLLPPQYDAIFFNEVGGQVYANALFDHQDRSRLFKLPDLTQALGSPSFHHVHIHDTTNNRALAIVYNKDGCKGLVDVAKPDHLLLPLRYDELTVCSHKGRVLVAATSAQNLLDGLVDLQNPQRPLLPFDYKHMQYVGDGSFPAFKAIHNGRNVLFPLDDSFEALAGPVVQKRFVFLQRWGLALDFHLTRAACRASDESWNFLSSHEARHRYLRFLSDPFFEGFISRYGKSFSDFEISLVLGLLEHLGSGFDVSQVDVIAGKMSRILQSGLDVSGLVRALHEQRSHPQAAAIKLYLGNEEACLLNRGRVRVPGLTSDPISLASFVATYRSRGFSDLEAIMARPVRPGLQDESDIASAVGHLHLESPFIFLRELLQNSVDAQKAIEVPGRHRIEVDSYEVGGNLHVRVRDYGGMTEQDFVSKFLIPEESSKNFSDGNRGGFGIGFYSTLLDARWVRVRTALKESDEILTADFTVERDALGRLVDIKIRAGKKKNLSGFYGTEVESRRASRLAPLDAACLKVMVEDIGAYLNRDLATLIFNRTILNKVHVPLEVVSLKDLGRVELYDGERNRILLGGLPVLDLPETLWQSVPEGIRGFYKRAGFYLNLDHTRLRLTPTRDRFVDHDRVIQTLARHLPALLIKGFLTRVLQREKPEDLTMIPEVYFVRAYEMTRSEKIGEEIIRDAARINRGETLPDYSPYADERNLLKLLTVLQFIPHPTKAPVKISLRELAALQQKALAGNKSARAVLEKIRPILPPALNQRLARAEADHSLELTTDKEIVDTIGSQALNRKFDRTQIGSASYQLYLDFLHELIALYYAQGDVVTGLNTLADKHNAFAYHYRASGGTYHLYRSFNDHLENDVLAFMQSLQEKDNGRSWRSFRGVLVKNLEVATHELTHLLTEQADTPDFTHDAKFYSDQQRLILKQAVARLNAKTRWQNYRERARGMELPKPWVQVLRETLSRAASASTKPAPQAGFAKAAFIKAAAVAPLPLTSLPNPVRLGLVGRPSVTLKGVL